MEIETIVLMVANTAATTYMVYLAMGILFEPPAGKDRVLALYYFLHFACVSLVFVLGRGRAPYLITLTNILFVFLISTRYPLRRTDTAKPLSIWLYRGAAALSIFLFLAVTEWIFYSLCMLLSRVFPPAAHPGFRYLAEKLPVLFFLWSCSRHQNIRMKQVLAYQRGKIVFILPLLSLLFAGIVSTDPQTVSPSQLIWTIALLLVNILFFFLLDQLAKMAHANAMRELKAFETDSVQSYLAAIKNHQEQAREIRHDVKQMTQVLAGYIRADEKQRALEYLAQLGSLADSTSPLSQSGNLDFDILLNSLLHYAESRGIRVSLNIRVPAKIDVPPLDLHRILANLINNAIEANETLPANIKALSLRITHAKDTLVVILQNPFDGQLVKHGERLLSRKKGIGHGYGLQNVQKIVVDEYGGAFHISAQNGVFEVRLNFFAPEGACGQ